VKGFVSAVPPAYHNLQNISHLRAANKKYGVFSARRSISIPTATIGAKLVRAQVSHPKGKGPVTFKPTFKVYSSLVGSKPDFTWGVYMPSGNYKHLKATQSPTLTLNLTSWSHNKSAVVVRGADTYEIAKAKVATGIPGTRIVRTVKLKKTNKITGLSMAHGVSVNNKCLGKTELATSEEHRPYKALHTSSRKLT